MNISILPSSPLRDEVLARYGVVPFGRFDPAQACRDRIEYLKRFLKAHGLHGFVLGISGGVDSTTAGRLAQVACEQLRAQGHPAWFHAVRLPAHVQHDEADAVAALAFISPDCVETIDIGPAADALNEQALASLPTPLAPAPADYHKGNIKARLRMAAQYYLAAVHGCAVLGTDHAAEAVMGFYTKGGDGQCDLLVLDGLNKRQVRACARHLGAPQAVWSKPPTADLEELCPGRLDEEGFGLPYQALDDFLEGKPVAPAHEARILEAYARTRHKREPVPGFRARRDPGDRVSR